MPIRQGREGKIWRLRDHRGIFLSWLGWLAGTLVFVTCARAVASRTTWPFVWDAPSQAADLVGRMWPPQWAYLGSLGGAIWDTLNIATLGTLLAILFAVPLAWAAARNTMPYRSVRGLALLAIVSSRSINSIVWALLLVAIFGPGVLAGILAIGFRSIGFIAKLLYEAIEEIDPAPVEAVTASGATPPQVLVFGIFPQVLPAFAGISIFRWDINLREATVVGLVGAGGLGLQLDACVAALEWSKASVIFVVVLALVMISETVSSRLRHAVT